VGTAIAILVPLLPSLISGVEALWSKLDGKQGAAKLSAVTKTVQALWSEMISAGVVPKGTPEPSIDAITGAIESVLGMLKQNGTITSGTGTKAALPSASYILSGTITIPSSGVIK
jgi:hypothetical protein